VLKQSLNLLLNFVQCLFTRLKAQPPTESAWVTKLQLAQIQNLCLHRFLFTSIKSGLHDNHIVTGIINALPGNSFVNTVQHATIDEALFYVVRTEQRWNNGVCNPLLGTGSVNTFPRIGPFHESGDVINNRDGVFRGVCAECL
jgi:hypothetical protein